MVSDILVGFNDQTVETPDELLSLLAGDIVGNATPVEVLRGGKPKTLKVTAAERPKPTRHRRRRGSHRGRRHAYWTGKPGMHKRFFRKGHRHWRGFGFQEYQDEVEPEDE